MLKGKKVILGVTGSIAAYKSAQLIRLLVKEGVEVKVVMSALAREFITPLTLATLSKSPVLIDFFNPENGDWNSHVDLGLWADAYVVAPATANTIGKMANGIADNLLLTTYLSSKCPVFVAPAMDLDMFAHPSTHRNLETLKQYGNYIIEPATGELASGLDGKGRMEEPEKIVQYLDNYFEPKNMAGKKVLITAGPTYEKIDPVRFVGNYSSGKMGFALAEVCAKQGAEVTLVTGPVSLSLKNKNIVFHLVLCLLTALALFFQIALFTGGDMRVTSASLKDPHMTSAMSSKGVPVDRVKSYLPNGTEFIATAQLYDAPHYTKIRFVWTYVTEKIKLTEFNMDSQESDEAVYIYSNITNDKIWPIGDYQVEIFLGERTKPDAVIKFKVSENP